MKKKLPKKGLKKKTDLKKSIQIPIDDKIFKKRALPVLIEKIRVKEIDLNESISIHIGGEIARNHSLPIDYFIKISENLQELIFSLAKNDSSNDSTIDLSNFKIEICGFKEGSAVPQYKFTENIKYITGVDVLQQRQKVNSSFEKIIQIADSGNYSELKTIYPSPSVRNDIVEKIYQYTNSFGNAPVEIVSISKTGKIIPLYKNHKLKPDAKKSLMVDIVDATTDEVSHENAVGNITVTKSKKGTRNKISHVYKEKDASLSYKVNEIVHGKTKYILNSYFMSDIGREDDHYIINSDLLGITGTGLTEKEAQESFAQEFDFIYKRYNELKDKECSSRISRIKTIINAIVSKVEKN